MSSTRVSRMVWPCDLVFCTEGAFFYVVSRMEELLDEPATFTVPIEEPE